MGLRGGAIQYEGHVGAQVLTVHFALRVPAGRICLSFFDISEFFWGDDIERVTPEVRRGQPFLILEKGHVGTSF